MPRREKESNLYCMAGKEGLILQVYANPLSCFLQMMLYIYRSHMILTGAHAGEMNVNMETEPSEVYF